MTSGSPSNWLAHREALSDNVWQIRISEGGDRLDFQQLIWLWRANPAFQLFWSGVLQNIPFDAYCWETPALTHATLDHPFECVCVNNPALAATCADPGPFMEHFNPDLNKPIVCFENLGADALLLAPTPQASAGAYTHLARFVRDAPASQVQALWAAVSRAVEARLGDEALWLSTAGLGVYWLHVRLDSRPKYYRYLPYANLSRGNSQT